MARGAIRIFGKWGKRRRQKQKKVLHERGFSKLKASLAKKGTRLEKPVSKGCAGMKKENCIGLQGRVKFFKIYKK